MLKMYEDIERDLLDRSVGPKMTNRPEDVEKIELLLDRAGYRPFDPTTGPSGMSGPVLDQVTREFQHDHGLHPDGLIYTDGPTIKALAAMGRSGDSELAHLTPGEVVIPKGLQTPELQRQLEAIFTANGIDIGRYTVGGTDDSINPRTGVREYFDNSGDWSDADWADSVGAGSNDNDGGGSDSTGGGGDDGDDGNWADFTAHYGDPAADPGTGSKGGGTGQGTYNEEDDAPFEEYGLNTGSQFGKFGGNGSTPGLGGALGGKDDTLGETGTTTGKAGNTDRNGDNEEETQTEADAQMALEAEGRYNAQFADKSASENGDARGSGGSGATGLTDGDVEDALFMDINSRYQAPSQAPEGKERDGATNSVTANYNDYLGSFGGLGGNNTGMQQQPTLYVGSGKPQTVRTNGKISVQLGSQTLGVDGLRYNVAWYALDKNGDRQTVFENSPPGPGKEYRAVSLGTKGTSEDISPPYNNPYGWEAVISISPQAKYSGNAGKSHLNIFTTP